MDPCWQIARLQMDPKCVHPTNIPGYFTSTVIIIADEMAGDDSDKDDDNGTPGIEEVKEHKERDFNDLVADTEDVHDMEKEEAQQELERQLDPDANENLIEQEAERHAQQMQDQ